MPLSICVNATPVTLTGTPAGGTFSGPGIIGNVFDPALAGEGGPYVITYTFTNENGCTSSDIQGVTVNPLPAVSFSGLAASYCSQAQPVNLVGSPAGGTFSGPGISGNTFNPSVAGEGGPYTITYSYTDPNGCSNSYSANVTVTNCTSTVDLNLTLFLEGFYRGEGFMDPTIYNLEMSTDPNETDTITVNLWSNDNLSNEAPDYSVKAVLHFDGTAAVQLPPAVNGSSFYIAVKHRNHIETWSADPVLFSPSTSYDFTDNIEKAYSDGSNPPMIEVETGIFALYAGDINQDGGIDGLDMNVIDNETGFYGYNNSDVNGDGGTDGLDMNYIDNNSQLALFYARPY